MTVKTKRILLILLFMAAVFGAIAYVNMRRQQVALLKAQVALLENQNQLLSQKTTADQKVIAQQVVAKNRRTGETQERIKSLNERIANFRARGATILAAMNDPGNISTRTELDAEIRDRKQNMAALQAQLSNVQAYSQSLDQQSTASEQAGSAQQAQAMADINNRIRTQQALILNTENAMRARRQQGGADYFEQVAALDNTLASQKANLENLRAYRDQLSDAAAGSQVRAKAQMAAQKAEISGSAQDLLAQIASLQTEVQTLQSRKEGTSRSLSELEQQSSYIDRQIRSAQIELQRLQAELQGSTSGK